MKFEGAREPTMDITEAIDNLLAVAREYGSSNVRSGDVVAAAYRLVAAKLQPFGLQTQTYAHQDLMRALECFATHAEKVS